MELDPFELRDVSRDPKYSGPLEKMRQAYADWRGRVPDWSDESEEQMIERFEPDGERRRTAEPRFSVQAGRLLIQSNTEGASIEIRQNGGRWRPYTGPLPLLPRASIEARAIRYGWHESPDVEWTAPRP